MWISLRDEDCAKMRAIAAHPVFSQYITAINYDGTFFDPIWGTQGVHRYRDCMGTRNRTKDIEDQVHLKTSKAIVRYSKTEVTRGAEHFDRFYKRQESTPLPKG